MSHYVSKFRNHKRKQTREQHKRDDRKTTNETHEIDLNFTPIVEKTRKKLNLWLQRDLSLKGRTLLSKAEGISRFTYAAISLMLVMLG